MSSGPSRGPDTSIWVGLPGEGVEGGGERKLAAGERHLWLNIWAPCFCASTRAAPSPDQIWANAYFLDKATSAPFRECFINFDVSAPVTSPVDHASTLVFASFLGKYLGL